MSLAVAAPSGAAVRYGTDLHAGIRLTLKGRMLTATIVRAKAGNEVFGKRIDAICSSRAPDPRHRRDWVRAVRRWPAGAARVRFRFKRDISASAKWCLIEHRAADVALVWFLKREPARFVAKGRGPAGDWWRLATWRGILAEPCMLVRSREWGARPCFAQFADRPVTLAAEQLAPCERDAIVFGVVSLAAAAVRVTTADGAISDATLYERPRGTRVRARYFVAVFPKDTEVTAIESVDATGRSLRRQDGLNGGTVCGPPG